MSWMCRRNTTQLIGVPSFDVGATLLAPSVQWDCHRTLTPLFQRACVRQLSRLRFSVIRADRMPTTVHPSWDNNQDRNFGPHRRKTFRTVSDEWQDKAVCCSGGSLFVLPPERERERERWPWHDIRVRSTVCSWFCTGQKVITVYWGANWNDSRLGNFTKENVATKNCLNSDQPLTVRR